MMSLPLITINIYIRQNVFKSHMHTGIILFQSCQIRFVQSIFRVQKQGPDF